MTSPTHTEDVYVCLDCLHTAKAIEYHDETLECESCGNDDLVTHHEWLRREREEDAAWNLAGDREADERLARAAAVAEPTYTEGCLMRRQAGGL